MPPTQGSEPHSQPAADAAHGTSSHAVGGARLKRHWRPILLVGFVLGTLVAAYFTPLGAMFKDPARLRHLVGDQLGIWLYPAIVFGTAVIVAMGIPRLALCVVGGMLADFWMGLLLVQLGTLMGDYALFLFVRWGGRNYVQHHWPRLQRMADVFHKQGIMGVILVRQFPVPGTLSNLVLGLSRLRHRDFLLGTTIGIFPEAIPAALFGAGLTKSSGGAMTGYVTAGVAVFAFVWIAITVVTKRLKETTQGSEIMAEVANIEDEENDG